MSTKHENNNVSTQPSSLLGAKSDLPPSSLAAVASKAAAGGGGSTVQNGQATSSSANSNKFSMYNINSQFKGKSIEPQQKTNIIRQIPSGLQTLGKVVAARRMPPPSNLPSLAKSTGTTIINPQNSNTSSGNDQASSASLNGSSSQINPAAGSNQNHAAGVSNEPAPVTIAAVVSGSATSSTLTPVTQVAGNASISSANSSSNGSWMPTASDPSAMPNEPQQQRPYKTYSIQQNGDRTSFPTWQMLSY